MRTNFTIRPLNHPQGCENRVCKYFEHAHALLEELELKNEEVESMWPKGTALPVMNKYAGYNSLLQITDQRNRLSDSVRIYSAMAVEGFLNLYGVLRLGQEEFDNQFERLGLIPKAKMLLLVCDSISVKKSDPLLIALDAVAQSRNALVHPKSREFEIYSDLQPLPHSCIPDSARNSVQNMCRFFSEFAAAVPDALPLIQSIH